MRTLAGNWQLLGLVPQAFLPWRNPIWFQFLSHKILRLFIPFAMVAALASSALSTDSATLAFYYVQLVFYGLALLAWLVPITRRASIFATPYTFVVINFAAIAGFVYWISGRLDRVWERPR